MNKISSSEVSLLRDLINETLESALYEAATRRSRLEILAITGPINARIEALTKQKRDRMYELLGDDDEIQRISGLVGDSYERLWPDEKRAFDIEIKRLEDSLIPLDREYWKSR